MSLAPLSNLLDVLVWILFPAVRQVVQGFRKPMIGNTKSPEPEPSHRSYSMSKGSHESGAQSSGFISYSSKSVGESRPSYQLSTNSLCSSAGSSSSPPLRSVAMSVLYAQFLLCQGLFSGKIRKLSVQIVEYPINHWTKTNDFFLGQFSLQVAHHGRIPHEHPSHAVLIQGFHIGPDLLHPMWHSCRFECALDTAHIEFKCHRNRCTNTGLSVTGSQTQCSQGSDQNLPHILAVCDFGQPTRF